MEDIKHMEKLKRYLVFFVGLFINSLGVSLITKASLGTSPISAIPYVLSLNFPWTLGQFTILFSILLILLQLLILRKNFRAEHLLQVPISILFGYFIDLTMVLLYFINPQNYLSQIVYLLIGCVILGFGVYIEVLANVAMLPGESFVRAVSSTWKLEFGSTKVAFDVSMTVIAAVLSFIFAHRLDGVREGTIIAALLVGFLARLFGRLLAFVEPLLFPATSATPAAAPEPQSSTHFTIVIGRQFGSGGHDLGKALAQRLGCSFYDNEIIQMTAGSTGYSPQFIQKKEENMTNSLLYDLVNQMYIYSSDHKAPQDEIFESEAKVIRELAAKESCVIVGRCGDYILREQPNCLRIFLHASLPYRIGRICRAENLNEKDAKQKIVQTDQHRADNYRYYTHQLWGHAPNYDLTLDTELGDELVQNIIIKALAQKCGVSPAHTS